MRRKRSGPSGVSHRDRGASSGRHSGVRVGEEAIEERHPVFDIPSSASRSPRTSWRAAVVEGQRSDRALARCMGIGHHDLV
jgi:hypothetical protein